MPPSRNRPKGSRFPGVRLSPFRSRRQQWKTDAQARIKRIMQMDEDVGKLAASVPHMISKSLECFMQVLIDEGSSQSHKRGSRKLTGYDLKNAIQQNANLDFLLEVAERIPDAPAPAAAGPSGSGGAKGRKASAAGGYGGVAHEGTAAAGKKRRKGVKQEDVGVGEGVKGEVPDSQPEGLPFVGTWRRDMEGGGGSGPGGRGLFDDYEEDDDDY